MPLLTVNHKTVYRCNRLVARWIHGMFAGVEVQQAEKV
jgi:hypothetical protein